MSKSKKWYKSIFFNFSILVLLLFFSTNAFGYIIWVGPWPSCDGIAPTWFNINHWRPPVGDVNTTWRWPVKGDTVYITHKYDVVCYPIIDSADPVVDCNVLYIGVNFSDQAASFTVNGGIINVSQFVNIGHAAVPLDDTLYVHGGVINCGSLRVGYDGRGVVSMDAGVIHVVDQLLVPAGIGSGTINLTGGTIDANNLYISSSGTATTSINLAGGQMIFARDPDAVIPTAVTNGKIKAFGGTGYVVMDEEINPGKITIYGAVITAKAYMPTPYKNQIDVNWTPILSWHAGIGATAHDVYIGEDADSLVQVASHQSGMSYNVTTALKYHKKYFWRVDEWDGSVTTTGDLWYFTTIMPTCDPVPAGDTNGDCKVNFHDLANVAISWLECNWVQTSACDQANW